MQQLHTHTHTPVCIDLATSCLSPVLQLRKDKWISVINVIEYGDIADFKAEQMALVSVNVCTGNSVHQLC